MTFNTGNPIGSTDARDLSDNAENFDTALGTTAATWIDRFGVTRDSFEGRLAKGSFYRVGDFATGYTLTNMRQTLEYSGHEYSWAGTFPKVVAAGSTPATSGGISSGAWVDRTDSTLRSQIADLEGASRYPELQIARWRDEGDVRGWGAVGDGVTDDTAAIQSAFSSTTKPVYFPKGDYRITNTLSRGEGLIVGDGFQSRLIFENLGGADGITFAPTTYQTTSGASHLAMITKGSNGGRAFSTPYDAVQYNTLYSNWKWDHLLFAGYTSPNPGTNNAFETIETWMCGIEQGDGFSCTIEHIYTRGNYRSDTDPTLQVQSCFLRLNAASALLTAYIGKFTATNIYRGVEIGDRCFFQIQRFDIAHSFDGIYQIGDPGNVYGESKVTKGNINAQHFGVYFEGISTREIDGVVVRRHRFGWKGATYDWQGIRLVDCNYMWVTNCQIAPDESGGTFTGVHYGMQLIDCGGVTITDPVFNPGLDRAVLTSNCTMIIIDGLRTFQNEATDIIFRAILNTRSSRIGSYVKVSSFIGTDYSDDGSIAAGAIQHNQRNIIPEGNSPQYIWRRMSSALNEKIWKAASGATTWGIQMTTDDGATNANAIILTRSGTSLSSVDMRTSRVVLANGPTINVGNASPEGSITASVGSIYMRTAGGAATSFYVKESGTGNTGWVAK